MKKTNVFLIFKLIGILGLAVAVCGIVLSVKGFGDFESNSFMIGGFLTSFGFFIGIACTVMGFQREIMRFTVKAHKQIQEENKEDLKDIASNSAEISAEAVKTVATAASEGFSEDTVFCKHCGERIDADSRFCRVCGEKQ